MFNDSTHFTVAEHLKSVSVSPSLLLCDSLLSFSSLELSVLAFLALGSSSLSATLLAERFPLPLVPLKEKWYYSERLRTFSSLIPLTHTQQSMRVIIVMLSLTKIGKPQLNEYSWVYLGVRTWNIISLIGLLVCASSYSMSKCVHN